MTTSKDYDQLVEGFRDKIRGNISSVKLTESECAAEVKAITGAVFIEPVPIITPTAQELYVIAATVLQPKKRGRPLGSRNKPKAPKGS